MKILNRVMTYFGMVQSKNTLESQKVASEVTVVSSSENIQGAKVAAITATLHHQDLDNSDQRAKVAAIAAALHHHETGISQNSGLLGIATLAAVIHHHNNLKEKQG
jgi:hypothetical protein